MRTIPHTDPIPSTWGAMDRTAPESQPEPNEESVRQEIAQAFAFLGKVPASAIALPELHFHHGHWKVSHTNAREAIEDRLSSGYCIAELMQVLEKSQCALVQKLREAIAQSWADTWASDIAAYRVGDWE
jgi:hypothetical protein